MSVDPCGLRQGTEMVKGRSGVNAIPANYGLKKAFHLKERRKLSMIGFDLFSVVSVIFSSA